jgi:hypothetical protein
MASHLRTLRGGKVSFFLFMDTITAVTAMLIMVALMMTLYFGDAPVTVPGGADPSQLEQTLKQLEQITAQNQTMRLQLAAANSVPEAERLSADLANLRVQITNQNSTLAQLQVRVTELESDAQHKANELGVGEEHRQIEETRRQAEAARSTNRLAQAELDELVKKTTDTETQLEKSRRERSKLWLIPEADGSGKRPLLVCLSATNLVCERFNEPQSRKEFPASAAEHQFESLLRELRPTRDYFVFYIRPSGIPAFQQFNTMAKHAGFNVGYDAVEEDRQILFSQPQQGP